MKGNRNCWKRNFCSWKDKRGTSCSFWLKRKGTLCSNLLLTDQIVPKFADLCSYCANKVPLLCVPRLFLKQLKEHKAKTRGTLRFWKRDVSLCRVTNASQTWKVSSCKKRPDNTEDKNGIENYSVLTWNVAIITFGECIRSFPKNSVPFIEGKYRENLSHFAKNYK